jgi:hypothetical protein
MKTVAAFIVGILLATLICGPYAMATDGTNGTEGPAMLDADTEQLYDSQHPNHIIVFPSQTVTLTGHGTSTVTGLGTLYAGDGIGFPVTSTATDTTVGTGTGTSTMNSTQTGSSTATKSLFTGYAGTGTLTGTATRTITATMTATGSKTMSVTVTGTGTSIITGTISSTSGWTASATNTITGTDSDEVTATGTGEITFTQTATAASSTATGTHTAYVTNTGTVTLTVTATGTNVGNYTVSGTVTATQSATVTRTDTETSATVASNPTIANIRPFGYQTIWLKQTASDIATYDNASTARPDTIETAKDRAVYINSSSGEVFIQSFATELGYPGVVIPAGDWTINAYPYCTGGSSGTAFIKWYVYRRSFSGTETLLFYVQTTGEVNCSEADSVLNSASYNPGKVVMGSSERIVIKAYGISTSATDEYVGFYYDGRYGFTLIDTYLESTPGGYHAYGYFSCMDTPILKDFVPAGHRDELKFLRGDGTWANPPTE